MLRPPSCKDLALYIEVAAMKHSMLHTNTYTPHYHAPYVMYDFYDTPDMQ